VLTTDEDHETGHEQGNENPERGVGVLPAQLGKGLEVHSVDTGQEAQGQEDHAEDREPVDDPVGAVADHSHVEVQGFVENASYPRDVLTQTPHPVGEHVE